MLECELEAGTRITYDRPPGSGLEHHLLLIEGQLHVSVDGHTYELRPGDCLRYQLFGPSAFATSEQHSAKYLLVIL